MTEKKTSVCVCFSIEELPSATRQVAFTVYEDQTQYHSNGKRLTFDHVETNMGGNFNSSNSTFTCPVDGLYFFSFTIMGSTGYGDDGHATLRRDGSVGVGAWADYYAGNPHASNAAVITCSVGQEVYLQSENSGYMYSNSSRLVTFSGFLLSENEIHSAEINEIVNV